MLVSCLMLHHWTLTSQEAFVSIGTLSQKLIAKTDRTRDVKREENESSKSNPETQNQNVDESSITEPITSQTEMSHPPITHLQPIQKEKKRKKRKKRPT